MIGSGSARTIAAGAVPARTHSASTLDEELEPRPEGIRRIRPATFAPRCGWRTSITSPVAGSTPPQNESGSSRTRTSPSALPATSARPSGIGPQGLVPHDTALGGRGHALLEPTDHDVHADVRRRVPRPLA